MVSADGDAVVVDSPVYPPFYSFVEQDAADTVLRMTAAATGLLKLTRLQALTTAEFVAEFEHPAQGRGGGRQSCCCCADLVVEMQKIDKRPVIV